MSLEGEKVLVRGNRVLNVFVSTQQEGGERATVFFVHGSMANYMQFEDLITKLRNYYNVVAWDAYGCGGSDKPVGWEEYSADEHLEDVKAMIQKYKTSKNHLICHSFGTSQGIRLASISHNADYDINTLTLLGTAFSIPAGGPALFYLPVFILDWIQPWLTAKFAGIAFHDDCPPEIIEKSNEQSNRNPMHVCQAFYRQFQWCTVEEIDRVECPVMILQGEGDKLTPVEGAQQLHDKLKRSELHIVKVAGHQVMQETSSFSCVWRNFFLFLQNFNENITICA